MKVKDECAEAANFLGRLESPPTGVSALLARGYLPW